MKITKSQLKQIIKEEIEASEELLQALNKLTNKIDDLDISLDYLSAAVTGEDPLSIGAAQRGRGRGATPGIRIDRGETGNLEEKEDHSDTDKECEDKPMKRPPADPLGDSVKARQQRATAQGKRK